MPKVRETTVDSWFLAIEDALEYRREYGRESEWAKIEAMFYQAHETQIDNVGPNILMSTGDSMLSSLLVPNPFYMIKAHDMRLLNAAPVLETQLNKLLESLDIKKEVEQCGLHAYLWSKGILKIGYDSEFGYTPEFDFGAEQNQFFGLSLTQFDKKGSRIEYDNTVNPGMPWVRAVNPHDFLVPDGVKYIKNSPWAAHRIVRHIDDLRADPKYSKTRDLEPTMSMKDWTQSYLTVMKPYRMGKTQWSSATNQSDKAEYVELWEIHDARTRRVQVLATGYDEFIRDDIDYTQVDGLPFIELGFIPRSRTFWTTPDAIYLKNVQSEAIDIAAVQKTQRRMSTLRFGYEDGAIEADELTNFMSGKIGIGFKFKNPSGGNVPIIPITPANNNNQLAQEDENMRRNARETLGLGRNQVGGTNPGRPTATEINIANDKSEMRMTRREDAVATLYKELGCKLAKLIFTYWRTPRLIDIVGQSGAAEWISFTGTQIKGDYQYSVGFSSEPVETKQSRITRALQLYQGLAADPAIDPIALRRMLIRAFNDPDVTSIFLPGVTQNADLSVLMPPVQQQMGGQQQQSSQQRGNGQQRQLPNSQMQGSAAKGVQQSGSSQSMGQ